jgi:hypothetical protein
MESIDAIKLDTLKVKIEGLSKFHQIEVLKILSHNLCKLNENKSGIFVNMSFLPNEVIGELEKYVRYVEEQDNTINTIEFKKEEFKNILAEHDTSEAILSYTSTK